MVQRTLALRQTLALAALAGALFGASFVACAAHAEDITIGMAMKTHTELRWKFDEEIMKDEAAKLGVKLNFQWADNSPTTQASQFENLLSQKVNAIVIIPIDSAAAGRLIDEAHEQKVPVISYDVPVSSARLDFMVERNNAEVGVLQANAALRFAPKGNYVIIKGEPGNSVAAIFGEGAERILKANKDVNIVYDQFMANWDQKGAEAVAENQLSAHNDDIAAFVTSNDGMGQGVAQAVIGRNLAGKIFISGLDADTASLRLIAQGVQTMTVWTDLDEQDRAAIRAAVALAKGQKPDMTTVMTDDGKGPYPYHPIKVLEVNKDNLCDFVTKIAPKGWVEAKEVFPDNPDACK
ncbi:MAG: substrate-binding domain-containing protein [Acetobacteraceae bacterium]|nr:substrate-binding domain-containing protein [Acetobacteraceae bacterium]